MATRRRAFKRGDTLLDITRAMILGEVLWVLTVDGLTSYIVSDTVLNQVVEIQENNAIKIT